ncbi:DapH/DapD/GlmU-related protein [Candidatus Portiera aleyrodidarum]|uniref:2,3,4,5-tetrahydropyridine-2,6-dicarboxylate N-succinyltransferase n=1 Tax=Candidatus Portiera aleyrodidarum MED (Bemisia tabaci) TaxID=1163752 RepID=A0AAU8S7I1_9GAMM|nr:DapH/DapD/GlmU-related protein [Candidatus Portiera aleyrodidarum]AFQ24140.1 tetrahydrodipicolinate N-succinyltransferase [Candidatus Portiera aleyrodidarum BT-B-HRs]AFS18902.1 2,3,4,5-tetrahydropyridine-2,6-dicarboxylate N-succinyltransferase [Candidatus Portiera aleyrodidarum BT-QVLC]AFT80536.1 2,3,4,5-tetrahydropyridine-2,6-dicarboxylate N-succinyltransferase [Candidatus Portiera aleyrodidarum BT-QVLC]AFT80816.1 tetrahydropyridine-dicarboxylate N-succinyltransferase [Candidatus Portiera a
MILSYGLGIASKNYKNEILEVYYPFTVLYPHPTVIKNILRKLTFKLNIISNSFNLYLSNNNDLFFLYLELNNIGEVKLAKQIKCFFFTKAFLILTFIFDDKNPLNIADSFFRLHTLSYRLCKPNSLNLFGIFSVMKTICWTNIGPIDCEEILVTKTKAKLTNINFTILSIDKFPQMTDYIVPNNVRIAEPSRIRLGAYLGEGTTIMHEGFCNFNAGTMGTCMIEGRISSGVFINKNSDLGGGSSILGTLSGGGKLVISLGKNCLIGANAGCGIPLGNSCIIEAGLYITASSKVSVLNRKNILIKIVKAKVLAYKNNLLFLRNSVTGAIECRINKKVIKLNKELHKLF